MSDKKEDVKQEQKFKLEVQRTGEESYASQIEATGMDFHEVVRILSDIVVGAGKNGDFIEGGKLVLSISFFDNGEVIAFPNEDMTLSNDLFEEIKSAVNAFSKKRAQDRPSYH